MVYDYVPEAAPACLRQQPSELTSDARLVIASLISLTTSRQITMHDERSSALSAFREPARPERLSVGRPSQHLSLGAARHDHWRRRRSAAEPCRIAGRDQTPGSIGTVLRWPERASRRERQDDDRCKPPHESHGAARPTPSRFRHQLPSSSPCGQAANLRRDERRDATRSVVESRVTRQSLKMFAEYLPVQPSGREIDKHVVRGAGRSDDRIRCRGDTGWISVLDHHRFLIIVSGDR